MKKMGPEKVRVLPNVTQLVGLYHLRLMISSKQLMTTVSEQEKDWLKIYWKKIAENNFGDNVGRQTE